MPAPFEKTCDACHERAATHHSIDGYTGKVRALCRSCFERSASGAEISSHRQLEERIRSGKCDYCGAPPVEASICYEIPGAMEEEAHFFCKQCRQDLAEFASRPENAIPEDVDPEDPEDDTKMEQISQALAERKRREEEFMRQRVKRRPR